MGVKISKLKTGKYRMTFSNENKVKRLVVNSKSQALEIKREYELQIARGKMGWTTKKKKTKLFKEVAVDWESFTQSRVKPGTADRYSTILRLHLLPKFGKMDIEEIEPNEIFQYLDEFYRNGKSVSFIQVVTSVLTQVFTHAVESKIISKMPMTGISKRLKLKKPNNNTPPFTSAEVQAILNSAKTIGEMYHTLFLFTFRTGCRVGEVLGLHWDDIDWENNTVTISRTCHSKICGTPKNNEERTIDLSPQLVEALRKYKSIDAQRCLKIGQKPCIVFNNKGEYMYNQAVRLRWIKILERAKIPFVKFHHIRHSFASLMIDAGVNPSAVQHTLGHHSAAFTLETYSRRIQHKEAVTAVLDSVAIPAEKQAF